MTLLSPLLAKLKLTLLIPSLSFGIFLFSCREPKKVDSIDNLNTEIAGLASPVILNYDKTLVYTADYFRDVSKIDSLSGHDDLILKLSANKEELEIMPRVSIIPLLSELKVWIAGKSYSLLLKRSKKINQSIRLADAKGQYGVVQLAGEMNNWNPATGNMVMKDGYWGIEIPLNPGTYQYQLVVDGKWILDTGNPDKADNNIGGVNSVLTVSGSQQPVPKLFPFSVNSEKLSLKYEFDITEIFVFWQNSLVDGRNIEKNEEGFTINIPEEADREKRSYIRVWAYNEAGLSNDLLIPLENGNVLTSTASLDRNDKEASIMYFMLVDRFLNGSTSNDEPVDDSEVAPMANYYGGDLAGVNQKIKDGYFSELGVNTLWLSPIVQNPKEAYVEFPEPHRKFSGYHGYWPISSTKVDYRFGTSGELTDLISMAHKSNMNVLMDFVANHVHEKHPLYLAHPDWATNLYLTDSSLNIRIWDEQRLTTWFDKFLPSLDFSNPVVVEAQSDSAMFWLESYGLDGFRHDATKHIPEIFWRTLTRKIKNKASQEKNKRYYQIGETFGSRELIGSYVNSGQLDAQFDFNLYFDARTVFAVDDASFLILDKSLHESFSYYGNHHLMGNISGNHDIPRFISYAGEAITFTEDAKEAGWTRDVQIKNSVGYDKLTSLMAFIMTIPGIPIIYYGDEIGMVGAGDPDNRRPMEFTNLTDKEKETKNIISKLVKLRSSRLSLIYGDFETLKANSNEYAYVRNYFGEATIVVFNKSKDEKEISFELPGWMIKGDLTAIFGAQVQKTDDRITVKLMPFSFEIITTKAL